MFASFINFAFLLLITCEFQSVFNQKDYRNYDYYYGKDYQPIEQQKWSRSRHRFGIIYYKKDAQIKERAKIGIVDSVLGLITGGKCLIKCVLRFVKNCYGIIGCIWDCFLPQQPFPSRIDANKDKDIKITWEDDHSEDMTPRDIIRIGECFTMCLVKYLPRNVLTLVDWLMCMVSRCLCIGSKE